MKIQAYSDNKPTKLFDVEIIENDNGPIVSLGFPMQWYLKDILEPPRAGDDRMYIDACGRNLGASTYILHSKLLSILTKDMEDKLEALTGTGKLLELISSIKEII